jgi:hypothetical protein
MKDHLISRSKFLDALVLDADNKTDLIQVHQALEKAVISPDEVRGVGEWEDAQQHGLVRCSVCKDCYIERDYIAQAKWRYCPNCGARMKGVSEDA